MMQTYFAQTSSYNQERIRKAELERDLKIGIPDSYGRMFTDLKDHQREVYNLNPYAPKMNALFGTQINNRKSIIVQPEDDAMQETADQWTEVLLKVQSKDKFDEKCSDVFDGSNTSGFDLLHFNITMDSDLTNRIYSEHIPFCSFYIDNAFKKKDLSDCKYINTWGYLTCDEIKYCLPDYADNLNDILCCNRENPTPNDQIAKIKLDEFWYLDYRKAQMVQNLDTKRAFEWDGTQEELDYFLRNSPNFRKVEHVIPTVNLALALNNTIFHNDWNPLRLDRYPFAASLCNFEKTLTTSYRSYGYIYNLIGAGYMGARGQTLLLKNIEEMVYRKRIYKPSSMVNPKEAQDPSMEMGISLKEEASMGDFTLVPANDITAQLTNFITSMNNALQNTSGMNDAMMGTSDDDSGIKLVLRQGAGLNIHAPIFNNFDIFMRNCGEIMYELVRLHYSYDKITTMLNKEPTTEFYTKIFGNYQVQIVQGTNTTTQQAIQTKHLLDMTKAGIPVDPMDIFDTYPAQGKSKLRPKIAQRLEQQQQAQAQQAQIDMMKDQLAMELRQSEINSLNTNAEYNVAKAEERKSKVPDNLTSAMGNIASAEKDRSQEILNIAKAVDDVKSNFEQITRLLERIERSQNIGVVTNGQKENELTNGQIPIEQRIQGPTEIAERSENSIPEATESVGELLRSTT